MSAPDKDQRTVPATPKRIKDFRRQGRIALSRDLSAVATFGGGIAVGLANVQGSLQSIAQFVAKIMGGADRIPLYEALPLASSTFASAVGPTAAGAIGGWAIASAVQLGFPPAFKKPSVDFLKPFSAEAVAEVLSPKKQAERALKAAAKLTFVAAAAIIGAFKEWEQFNNAPALEPASLIATLISAVLRIALHAGFALGVLAALDYALARRRMTTEMKMTPEELKREMREQEGDPQIKARRRRRMRELAKRRLTAAVKSSDVVIVNPTEFAVALRYRSKKDRAPRVVAKGKGAAAERIREIARAAGVPIMPNIPLARFLFKVVPEGREIPASVFQTVAEVLGYVYKIQKRGPR